MFRSRGNLGSARKPGVDPIISSELQKIIHAVSNITYGTSFPGRQATFGDMHYYTGEDTTSYKKNNWYIRTTDADADWQSMNATSVPAENIQAGTIGSGVKVLDYLPLLGGELLGKVTFHEDQTFKPEMMESGVIPPSVSVAGYVPATGGSYIGNIDMTDHNFSSVKTIYGYDNLIYVDMSVDGHMTIAADAHLIFIAPVIDFTGALGIIGALDVSDTVTASRFISDVADGTAPYSTTSTTLNTNLNADRVDGVHVATLTNTKLVRYNSTGTKLETGTVVESSGALSAITTIGMSGQLTNTLADGTAPLAVTSTTVNPNLNADMVDGSHASAFAPVAHDQNASTIIIPGGIGTPSYDDLQDYLRMTRSAGRLTGGVVTAHAGPNGTVDISSMEGMIFTTNSLGGTYIYFKQAAATAGLALTDLSVNWVYFDWNGGAPRYMATTDRSTINEYNQFAVGRAWRSGNTVEVLATGHSLYDKDRRSHNRLILKYGAMDRVSGGNITAHATPLRLQSDAGSWYVANTPFTTLAADTVQAVWYKSGSSTWVKSSPITLFSEVFDGGTNRVYETYQNGNTLGALGASKYGVYWIFICPSDGHLNVVLGTSSYNTIGTAQASTVPSSLPPYCVNWARFVGRVIIQKTAAAFYSVESAFAQTFTLSAATDHASLYNLAYGSSGHTGFQAQLTYDSDYRAYVVT